MTGKEAIFSVLIAMLVSVQAAAGPIDSLRTAMLEENSGKAYIAASYPINHEGYEKPLTKLWEATPSNLPVDDYGQQWKLVDLDSLEDIFGSIPTHYDLIYPVTKSVKDEGGTYQRVFEGYKIERRSVEHAALFQWGCEGSIIPVLNIGNWPEHADDWSPSAIPAGRTSANAKIVALDLSLVPPAYMEQTEVTHKWITIKWPDTNVRATLVSYPSLSGDRYSLFAIGKYTDDFSYLKARSPMDSRC